MSKKIDFSKPLTEDEVLYIADRPWIVQDLEMSGIELTFESDLEEETDEEEEQTFEALDWDALEYPDLKAAATERGLDATGKKEDIKARLVEFHATAEEPEE